MSAITKLTDRFTQADIDSEIVIMRLDNGETFSLAGTAAAIWRLIDGSRDRAALIADAAGDFAANESDITADVDAFLVRLAETGLIAGA